VGVAHGAEAAGELRLALAGLIAGVLRVDAGGEHHVVDVLASSGWSFSAKRIAHGQRADRAGVARDAQHARVEFLLRTVASAVPRAVSV
jgi:hypothetical protein